MAAKACIYLQDPSSSRTVDVGSYVTVRMGIKNCGNESAYFYAGIEKNGVGCVAKYNQWLDPGEVLKFFTSVCDITSMPNSTINIKFHGGHAEGGAWHEDFVKYVTLTPKAAICNQPVRVIDENGVKIDNARVDCYEGSNFKAHCTTYYGDCLLSFLDVGTSYRAKASKTGYDCLNCEKTFTACTSRITLSLKKKPTTCNQSFIVKDTSGNTVTKNCIIVIREGTAHRGECATSTSGTCTATGLIKGASLRACIEQVPSGYELTSDSCKNFTSCTSRITLSLKKKPTDGILRVTTTPVQGADIYINDIKQSYKTNHDFTLEAGYYNVKVKLTGYKEPAMQGITVVAGQTNPLTFTLEEEAPTCPEYNTESECIAANCYWYDGACHEYAPVECSDYTDASTCEANNCYWWSDGTCHDTEEPSPDYKDTKIVWEEWVTDSAVNEEVTFAVRLMTDELISLGINGAPINFYANDVLLNEEPVITTDKPGVIGWNGYAEIKYTFIEAGLYNIKAVFPGVEGFNPSESAERTIDVASPSLIGNIENISCTATKEAEDSYSILATVTVKNPDTEVHEYYIKLYDPETEPEHYIGKWPPYVGVHVDHGNTTDIEIDTKLWDRTTTTKAKFELWESTFLDESLESQTKECSEIEIGKITKITCTSKEETDGTYEIEATVTFTNPDTSDHKYKAELLDAVSLKHLDTEPLTAVDLNPEETGTIDVNTILGDNCSTPLILIKLWETTYANALVDEKEHDCAAKEPSLWASLILWISDALGISESQSKLVAYGGIGLVALFFLSSILKR